jgi:hypothetical protein
MSRGEAKLGLGGVLLIILILLGALYVFGYLHIPKQAIQQPTNPPPPPPPPGQELVEIDAPLNLQFISQLGTGADNLLNGIEIYQGNLLVESYNAEQTFNNAYTTIYSYKSGTVLNIKATFSPTSSIRAIYWYQVVVPQVPKDLVQVYAQSGIPIKLYYVPLPLNMNIRVADQFGSTNGIFNFTAQNTNTAIFTITIQNPNLGTGFMSSQDPLYNINLGLWAVAQYSGSSLIVSGFDMQSARGLNTYFFKNIPDKATWYQQVGNQIVYNGVYSFQITINKGSLAHGMSETITLHLYAYFDPSYFNQFGVGSPYVIDYGSITLTLKA